MIVEEFWKKNQAWNPKDDFDKQTVRFNYWDMLDFAEQYASKQLELTEVGCKREQLMQAYKEGFNAATDALKEANKAVQEKNLH